MGHKSELELPNHSSFESQDDSPNLNDPDELTADEIAAKFPFVLIRGQAGCGKTTLLRWLAVQMARGKFIFQLNNSNSAAIPFYIRLRDFSGKELPQPQDFLYFAARNLEGEMPHGWVHTMLRESGGSVILIDGIDELRTHERERVRGWITDMQATFPNTRMIVTSRPSAVSSGWLNEEHFVPVEVKPLRGDVIPNFIQFWHEAVKQKLTSQDEKDLLDALSADLPERIMSSATYLNLAQTPLLLGALCALNRERNRVLPENRIRLYRDLIDMLIQRRDTERGIKSEHQLDGSSQQQLLQRIAYWMVSNNYPVAKKADVIMQIKRQKPANVSLTPEQVFQVLLERSGILREPVLDEVDFAHLTMQEFLAAEEAVYRMDVQPLLDNCENDRWERVIQFAGGISGESNSRYQAQLLQGLLNLHQSFLALESARTTIGGDSLKVVKDCVQDAVEQLISMGQVNSIAAVKEAALEYLGFDASKSAFHLGLRVVILSNIGGEAAYRILESYKGYNSPIVIDILMKYAAFSFSQERIIKDFLVLLKVKELTIYTSSLDGIKYLKELKELALVRSIDNWSIEDIRQLEYLHIDVSDLTELSFLENLPQLQSLSLYGHNLSDLNFLKNLPKLQYLRLGGIAISSLSFLKYLPQLQSLDFILEESSISNLSFFKQVPELQYLSIRARNVSDLSFLNYIPKLKNFDFNLYDNEIKDLSFLGNLSQLQHLNLDGNNISDLSFLDHLPQLQSLSIYGHNLPDLNFLENLPKLQYLRLSGGKVDNLNFLENLSQIQSLSLNLGERKSYNLSFLKSLTQLQHFSISGDSLSDLSFLKSFTRLQSLYIQENQISDFSFLEHLPKLQELYISHQIILTSNTKRLISGLSSLNNFERW
jgi:NACHT domain